MSNVHVKATIAGREFDLLATTADYLNYEQTAYQQHFPPMDKGGQITWAAFMAWSAAKRTGQTEMKWAEWRTSVDELDLIDEEPVDPTAPAPEAG